MRTITEIQADIDAKNAAIDQEVANGQQANHDQINIWRMDLTTLNAELEARKAFDAQEQAAVQAQQAQVIQISGLKGTLSAIFEAAFPKDETVKLIGLTEYETTQQTFNQLVDQAVDENQNGLYAAFNEQLAQKDEKIKALNNQGLEVQKQLDDEKSLTQSQADELISRDKEIEDHKNTISVLEDEIKQHAAEIQRLKDHEFELQKQLNDIPPAPQAAIDITPVAPSESLSEKIAQAKAVSQKQLAEIKPFGNLYSDLIYTDGTKEVVHNSLIPSLQVSPTDTSVDQSNVESSTVASQGEVNPPNNFQPAETQLQHTEDNSGATGLASESQSGESQAVEQAVTRAEFETLQMRVSMIEHKLNPDLAA